MLEFGEHPEEYRICCSGAAVDHGAPGRAPELTAAIRSLLEAEGITVIEESHGHG
jgi:hypothetical protein